MRRYLDPILKLWKDRLWGPALRSYDAAREELGGVPWRNFGSTERWFLGASPPPLPPGAADKPITLDTSAIKICGPSWRERLEGRGRYFAGGAALLVVFVIIFAAGSGSAAHAPAAIAAAPAVTAPVVAAVAPAVAPQVAPAQHAPAQKPAAVGSQLSPELQALLNGTGKKGSKASAASSKKVARGQHKKGRRR
jgi:hypothetical protein